MASCIMVVILMFLNLSLALPLHTLSSLSSPSSLFSLSLSLSLSLQFYDIAFHVLFTLHDNHAMFSLDCLKFLLSRSFFLVLFARFLRVYFPNISTVRDIIMRANTVVKLVAKIDIKLVLVCLFWRN